MRVLRPVVCREFSPVIPFRETKRLQESNATLQHKLDNAEYALSTLPAHYRLQHNPSALYPYATPHDRAPVVGGRELPGERENAALDTTIGYVNARDTANDDGGCISEHDIRPPHPIPATIHRRNASRRASYAGPSDSTTAPPLCDPARVALALPRPVPVRPIRQRAESLELFRNPTERVPVASLGLRRGDGDSE